MGRGGGPVGSAAHFFPTGHALGPVVVIGQHGPRRQPVQDVLSAQIEERLAGSGDFENLHNKYAMFTSGDVNSLSNTLLPARLQGRV